MESSLRVGLIGVGKNAKQTWDKGGGHKIGYFHAEAIKACEGLELVAAADIVEDNLKAYQEAFDVPGGYLDYNTMLAEEELDVVVICTYVGTHARMIVDSAKAGVKAIHCEKPFVASPAELAEVEKVIEETGVKLVVAHIRRFKACFIQARQMIHAGVIGKPVIACGGLPGWDLSEFGSHWIDLIRFILNDPKAEYVMGQARVTDGFGYQHAMEDHAIAYVGFEGGCRLLVDGGQGLPTEDGDAELSTDIHIIGTAGSMIISEGSQIRLINHQGLKDIATLDTSDPFQELYTSLVIWLNGGAVSPVAFDYVAETAAINLGAYVSALHTDRIDLPMNAEVVKINRWPLDLIAESKP